MALGRLLWSVLAMGLLSFALSLTVAQAHEPERVDPDKGAVLDRPPASVDIWFPLELDSSRPAVLQVVHNPSGRRIDRGGDNALDSADPKHLRVLLEPDLAPGRYVVSWDASGAPDGHAVQGSYSFTVAEPERSNDDRVTLMLAAFGAGGFAVLVGSAGYLLRRLLGLTEPPPPQPPAEHDFRR